MIIEHIIYNITNKCNLSCVFCHKNIDNNEKPGLEPNEIEKVFNNLYNLSTLTITGGEPFIHPYINKFFENISTYKFLEELTLSTNGTLIQNLFKSLSTFLKSNHHTLLRIRISIHGFQKYHDGANNKPESFNRTLNNLISLIKYAAEYKNIIIYSSTVVTPDNIDSIISFVKWLRKSVNPDIIELIPVRDKLNNILYFSDQYQEKYHELSNEVMERYYFKNDQIADLIKLKNVRTVIENCFESNDKHCKAGVKHVYMDSNGDIYPCEFINDKTELLRRFDINISELKLGNVRDYNYNIQNVLEMNYRNTSIEKAIKCCHCGVPDIHRMNNWDNRS